MLGNVPSAPSPSLSAERSALVADLLRRGGGFNQVVRLRVHGESMLPALWPGDVVQIAGCSLEDVRSGEIVLALRDGRLFLHRFVARCPVDSFLLCGDSMPGSDPLFASEALLGRLVRGAGQPTSSALRPGLGAKCSRALGLLLGHCDVARRLALKLHTLRKGSQSEFDGAEPVGDLRSADLGAS